MSGGSSLISPINNPLRLAIAGAVALTALGGVLAFLAVRANGPVRIAVPQPSADVTAICGQLASRLPETLDGRSRRPTTPESDLVRAWGDPPVVLFCGVERPTALTPTSQLTTVNGLDWLPADEDGQWRFTVVGRVAYVELVVPKRDGTPTDLLVELADPIKEADPLSGARSSGATPAG
jgi:Protein of unknown function (DUF3515)